jgi:hypothetical protein
MRRFLLDTGIAGDHIRAGQLLGRDNRLRSRRGAGLAGRELGGVNPQPLVTRPESQAASTGRKRELGTPRGSV